MTGVLAVLFMGAGGVTLLRSAWLTTRARRGLHPRRIAGVPDPGRAARKLGYRLLLVAVILLVLPAFI